MFVKYSAWISIHMHVICLPNWNKLCEIVFHNRYRELARIFLLNCKP